MKSPLIASERLQLDAFEPTDAAAVHEYCDDVELQRWVPVPAPYTRADAELFTGQYARDAAATAAFTLWAIRAKTGTASDGTAGDGTSGTELVGAIELRFEPLKSATVGFWLGARHRGSGIMSEALGMLVDHAFDELGFDLDRLHWESLVGNNPSAAVARKAGFHFEGVSRRSLIHRGERVDSWQAVLLASDDRRPTDGWPL